MARQGDRHKCGVCGVEIICVEGCGCRKPRLVCCGKAMRKKTGRKTVKKKAEKSVKKTAKAKIRKADNKRI
ncbi:MAG: hypothetical protein GF416_04550 [Candidatus Altiarchaeales archaeon]|nr:hypothetical protein [Candidatus Altiarchaeales archaeon]MBD3416390.1 hypothetical protein [Candidatus Altiarchaeales archaeon]